MAASRTATPVLANSSTLVLMVENLVDSSISGASLRTLGSQNVGGAPVLSRRETLLAGVGAVAGIALVARSSLPPLSRARFAPLVGAALELERLDGTGTRHAVTLE